MEAEYRTVRGEGVAEIVEKKSRFIATVLPVADEAQAKQCIAELKKKYWDATHNVYAYQIGDRLQRFSDDGEPQGTAGMPVLEVLKGSGVRDALIVVTRYFGGTLLGTGGLVRAYGRAAGEGLKAAGVVERRLMAEFELVCDYNLYGKLEYKCQASGYQIISVQYTDKVTMRIMCPADDQQQLLWDMTETANAQAEVRKISEGFR